MTADDEVVALRAANAALRAENAQVRADLAAARDLIAQLQTRIAELEQRKTPPPPFVKTNTEQEAKGPRKKRDARHNAGRRREKPTQIVQHALERCPDCGYLLRGHSIARTRQVIDLPPPAPVVVTEHQLLKRYCPVCQRWWTPTPDWTGHVLGHGRVGVRLVSLIAYLRTVARLPLRTIQEYLATLHQVRLSTGALADLLDRVGHATAPQRAALLAQARASPVAHLDETGWRENGQNGYVWGLATPGPQPVRYYHYDRSRAGTVATDLLGDFEGHLGSDFYGGYNRYAGQHQRCWAHLLRDLHTLKENHAPDAGVVGWAQAVRALYDDAQAALDGPPLSATLRTKLARQLEAQAFRLGVRFAGVRGHPCRALARRLLRHQGELFEFVRVAGLTADNNAAERMLRPVVVQRKISGGTRSAQGSTTRMALATLFETWRARGLNAFHECLSVLHFPLSQI
jgi:transposase